MAAQAHNEGGCNERRGGAQTSSTVVSLTSIPQMCFVVSQVAAGEAIVAKPESDSPAGAKYTTAMPEEFFDANITFRQGTHTRKARRSEHR